MKSTIPKLKIFNSFVEDSIKLQFHEALFEWFSNSTYSNSEETFIYVTKEYDKMCIYYAFNRANEQIDLNNMISFKSSHNINNEIGHHGDGFKRFSYKHLGEMEIFSLNYDRKTYKYLKQSHNELKKLIDLGADNSFFEKVMDNSQYTQFTETYNNSNMTDNVKEFIKDKSLPFKPMFFVKFSNLDEEIKTYTEQKLFSSLKKIISFTNYTHLNGIYFRNDYLDEDKIFKKITNVDIRGDDKENVNLEIDSELYLDETNSKYPYYLLIDTYKEKSILIHLLEQKSNGKHLREEKDLNIIKKKPLVKVCDITIRELREEHNKNIKCILSKQKTDLPSCLLEKYAGVYIILNNIPINYICSLNEWFPKSGNLPGRSRYRCIINPCNQKYMNKMILTEGVKSNSRLSAETDWKFIILSNLNKIFKSYIESNVIRVEPDMPEIKDCNIIIQEKVITNVKYEYLYILKLNRDTYTFGKTPGVPFVNKKKNELIEIFKKCNPLIRINCNEKCNFMGVICLEKKKENFNIFLDTIHNSKGIIEIEEEYFKANTSKDVFILLNNFYLNCIENGLNIK
uniref:Uncharacterized protein n=1 Tax=Mimiviridae sp. ChoanoV1 TaxID=2596887 RepID=A0A5B8HX62_9VIRU|nr:hypothetical protein 10_4 [Mimiviridae sp. ChoanoV1]